MGFFEIFASALAGFYAVIPSFGIAIILLTLATRLLMLPLSIKQTRSMREMQTIQPQVKKLQQKHKGDRQKLNEEMMALYKEHGVNPFGGCLPLLLQMPVLIALYRVISLPDSYIPEASALAGDLADKAASVYRFLGFHLDCSLLDAARAQGGLETAACAPGNVVLATLPYVLLIALMGFTTFYQTKQMQATRTPGDQQAQQMQMDGRIMPAILIVFGLQFPAALVLYWLTTNLWTIAQQRIILGRLGPAPTTAGASGQGSARDKSAEPAKDGKGKAPKTGKTAPKKAPQSTANGSRNGPAKGAKTGARSPQAANKKRRKR